jgi:hypothetical protein
LINEPLEDNLPESGKKKKLKKRPNKGIRVGYMYWRDVKKEREREVW